MADFFWAALGLFATILAVGQSALRAFYEFNEDVLLIHLLLWTGPWLIMAWVGAMALSFWNARWRRLICAMVAPAIGLAIPFAYYVSGISPRFLIERPRFERVIASRPKDECGYKEFYWDETGFGLASTLRYIVTRRTCSPTR